MNEQLTLDNFELAEDNIFEDKFEPSEVENESEEDISDVGTLSFSDLAITGTDWTVETIVSQIKKGNILLDPSFQRRDAWNTKIKSRFIESLFIGLPIPQIILAEQKGKKGKFIVIDGKQRLLSLKQFASPDKGQPALKLTGLDVLAKFNRMTYSDIESSSYLDELEAFNNQPIRTVVIKNWKNVEVLYLLFLRLNTGSVKLSPQELRQALYPGQFIDFVAEESSHNKQLQKMLNITKPDVRMRDVEIMIRYFAFHFFADKYSGSMQNFLDTTCDKLNKVFLSGNNVDDALNAFNKAVETTFIVFSDKCAFRKFKNGKYEDKYNRAVIDIMLYYFSQIQDQSIIEKHALEIKSQFEALCCNDPAFLSSFETSTKNYDQVHYRFRKWGETLTGIVGYPFAIPTGY